MVNKKSFLHKRSVVAVFGIVALLSGFLFLNMGVFNPFTGKATGNFISQNNNPLTVNLISIIGILLITCSAILIIYAILKKE